VARLSQDLSLIELSPFSVGLQEALSLLFGYEQGPLLGGQPRHSLDLDGPPLLDGEDRLCGFSIAGRRIAVAPLLVFPCLFEVTLTLLLIRGLLRPHILFVLLRCGQVAGTD